MPSLEGFSWRGFSRATPISPVRNTSDRRRFPRLLGPCGLVHARLQGTLVAGELADLSLTGLAFHLPQAVEIQQRLPILLDLQAFFRPIPLIGRVVHCSPSSSVHPLHRVGVAFEALDQAEQLALFEYLSKFAR
jgi:hypothetical protein